ncbi:PadR family transcriptional regulator [Leucobacter coleopterorum]|uniref:PadR family transcriptional regulator n=1 Tax=Leucobacter coleopterorum TaxID=2714933 RepID=A0ABX6JXD0_9MICO|nr:PadR family transcriptional regulator [Leucobacter coleopterorum]QIM18969.1 PadR family transcriptional regulator [Leucobacter coleopterorum]
MANVILGLLMLGGPQTLYLLNKHFEQGASLIYRASLGALRGALNGLLARGEVEFEATVESGRKKKTYRPTAVGVEVFFEWLTGPITGSNVETAALSKLFFLGLLDTPEVRRAVLSDIVQRLEQDRAELSALGADLQEVSVPAEQAHVFGYQVATLEYGLSAHQLGIDFFRRLRDVEG